MLLVLWHWEEAEDHMMGFSVLQATGFGLATKPLPKEVLLALTAPTVSTDFVGPEA